MSSSATLTINVIDTQDTPPSFIGTPYFGYVYEISVPVNMTFSDIVLKQQLLIATINIKYVTTLVCILINLHA